LSGRRSSERQRLGELNLCGRPNAEVMIGGTTVAVRAREAGGEERAELWARFVAIDDSYAGYAQRTTRRIPVVILERR
jgi:hypothetical protein